MTTFMAIWTIFKKNLIKIFQYIYNNIFEKGIKKHEVAMLIQIHAVENFLAFEGQMTTCRNCPHYYAAYII